MDGKNNGRKGGRRRDGRKNGVRWREGIREETRYVGRVESRKGGTEENTVVDPD